MPSTRAIVFDLDDTLYPYSAFVHSGFRAVACRLARDRALPASAVLRVLRRAFTAGRRGEELQVLCERFGLPMSSVSPLAEEIREHAPTLRLPRESARVLRALRPRWKIGVLTNGEPRVQRRKIAALRLDALVDAIIFATEFGDRQGKPGRPAFRAVLDALKVEADRTVFVGDDPHADIEGAVEAGMKAIHVVTAFSVDDRCSAAACRIHVTGLALVPSIAEQLVPAELESYVA